MYKLAVLGSSIAALTWLGLALHVPGADSVGSPARTSVFVAIMAAAGVLFLLAVRQVLGRPRWNRGAMWLVLAVAAAMRLPLLPVPPFLSSDLYRYVWDGKVQAAGINPYRYIPADPSLASLRDSDIYPRVNRRTYAPTIYAPAAEIVFGGLGKLGGSWFGMKLAMLGFELLGMACVLRVLHLAGLSPARLLIYSWNPLAAWCFAGDGHVDAIAIGFLGLALLARARNRGLLTGIALAAATLTKFLPAAIGPALWRGWKTPADWRMPVAFLCTLVLLYLPYLGVGWNVLGFLPGYGGEEGVEDGSGIWLLAGIKNLAGLPRAAVAAYLIAAILALAALACRIALRPRPRDQATDIPRVCGDASLLAACTMAVVSPHYPWYFVWLGLPACVQPYRAVIWLSVAPLLLYLDPLHEHFVWASLIYVPAILLAAGDLAPRCRALMTWPALARERRG